MAWVKPAVPGDLDSKRRMSLNVCGIITLEIGLISFSIFVFIILTSNGFNVYSMLTNEHAFVSAS